MASAARVLYNGLFVPFARVGLPVAARLTPKLGEGLRARRGVLARWRAAAWRAAGRRPRIWFHAASAGEALQARALVETVRVVRPDAAIFFSYWSISATPYTEGWEAPDHADLLPVDFPGRMRRLVEWVEPEAVVLVGAETWPNFIWAATDAGIPVAQACCRLAAESARLRWPMRIVTRDLYRRMAAVATIGEADAARVRALGVTAEAVGVTGDTRIDATMDRAARAETPWRPAEGAGPVVVAGSTHPRDEAALLPALAELRRAHPALLAVVAPHEPTPAALAALEESARRLALSTRRLGALSAGERPAVVLVDRTGVLYRLYAVADVAFVGGAFDGSVHNTMEPAAHGVPIVVGPRPGPFHEVAELRAAGGLAVARSAEELAPAIARWLADPALRSAAGRAARETLERHRGATSRTLRFLRERGLPL